MKRTVRDATITHAMVSKIHQVAASSIIAFPASNPLSANNNYNNKNHRGQG